MRDFAKHLPHYLALAGLLGVALVGFIVFSYDRRLQSAVVLAAGLGFLTWGVVHHHIHEDLSLRIILEYLATVALGVAVLLAIIWRA